MVTGVKFKTNVTFYDLANADVLVQRPCIAQQNTVLAKVVMFPQVGSMCLTALDTRSMVP